MLNPSPTVQRFMTRAPHTIGADETLADAHAVLRAHQIRHLPVVVESRLVGMITLHDLHLIETLPDVNPAEVKVSEAMVSNVFSVSPETPLADVVKAMAEHKYGSAVVMRDQRVLGIFTTVDVCRALGEVLQARTAA